MGRAGSRVIEGTGRGCCRSSASTRSSSIGRSGVAAATCSARVSGSRLASRHAIRSPSCRRSRSMVTEHRLHAGALPGLRPGRAVPRLPAEVAVGAFGPRLAGRGRDARGPQPRLAPRPRRAAASELFGCADQRPARVDAIVQRTGEALAGPTPPARSQIRAAAARQRRRDRLAAPRRAAHALGRVQPTARACCGSRPTDTNATLEALLGEDVQRDRLTSDRWWAYDQLPPTTAAVLGAPAARLQRPRRRHGRRERLRRGRAADLRRALLGLGDLPARPATGASSNAGSRRCAASSSRSCALRGQSARNRYTRRMARNLLKLWPALWTFAERRRRRADQQPRRTRPARRGHLPQALLGSQSDHGERTHRTTPLGLTPPAASSNARSSTYLTDVLTAHARGDPVPPLA